MKIHYLDELPSFGISILTGESCALSMRLLIELETEQAIIDVANFLGLPPRRESFSESWGRGLCSLMLAPGSTLLDLLAFLMAKSYPLVAIIQPPYGFGTQYVLGAAQDEQDKFNQAVANTISHHGQVRQFVRSDVFNHPFDPSSLRNVHHWSGRTA